MRTLTALFAVACLGASPFAAAQSSLGTHSRIECRDLVSSVDHNRPAISDWVAQAKRHPIVWSDNRLIVNAAAPAGLIVDECRNPV
jgi:hypothetical protein